MTDSNRHHLLGGQRYYLYTNTTYNKGIDRIRTCNQGLPTWLVPFTDNVVHEALPIELLSHFGGYDGIRTRNHLRDRQVHYSIVLHIHIWWELLVMLQRIAIIGRTLYFWAKLPYQASDNGTCTHTTRGDNISVRLTACAASYLTNASCRWSSAT